MYILPRMQALRFACPLLAALLSLPLTAQNAHIHNTGPQDNLRIKVKVVPAIGIHPRDKDDDDKNDKDKGGKDHTVSYTLNPRHQEFSVTEELCPMLVESGNTIREEQVRAITVVPK
ncbi:MAG TPA: hypothetical protein VGK01_09685 [Candidatus Angelobacter sp.]|jgi:hypothetical protein